MKKVILKNQIKISILKNKFKKTKYAKIDFIFSKKKITLPVIQTKIMTRTRNSLEVFRK